MAPNNAPAGWYDDGTGGKRYWDGTNWTEHTVPADPTVIPSPTMAPTAASEAATPAAPVDAPATNSGYISGPPVATSALFEPVPSANPSASQPYAAAPQSFGFTEPNRVPPAPYGVAQHPYGAAASTTIPPVTPPVGQKSFVATWLLAWLVGFWGVDRFYLGKVGTGLAKLFTFGGLGVWVLIDLILVLTGSQRDNRGQPLAGYNEHKKLAWIITGAVVAFGLVINIISGAAAGARNAADLPAAPPAAVSESEPAADAEAETEVVVPEPEPEAELGTAASPFPQPYVAKGMLGGEKYSLTASVTADGQDVTEYNMFNEPAPAGFKYVIVQATMTGIDPDGVEPSLAAFDLMLATAEGNQYDSDYVTLGDGMPSMYDGPTLYPGNAFTGYMAFVVPEGATGFMLHDNGNYIAL
ncbi:NINE protein [Agromyces sp. PvR057]|uniref:NINE protein n=1 Tax=Agromyces sp. PvR057 TaxID=3156403 RepID=UPI003394CB15